MERHHQFGRIRPWFGVEFGGPFIPNTPIARKSIRNTVIADVSVNQEPFGGTPVGFFIGDNEPVRLFSF